MSPLDDAVYFLTLRELGARLKSRSLSPVALAEGCLDRLERIGSKLNAVVTVMRESALKDAHRAEDEIHRGKYRGPLHGIPFGVKDLLATHDAPTTWGAEPYRHQKFDYDAAVVERLRAAGAVLVAKLAMVELAGGMGYNNADASFTGPGLTPWNTSFWSGGSSSGPGAAVAAGLVPFALGSETSGSILTPSAYSGVTGLRPTYGLVPRHGAMALSWTLDKVGPMARSADCAGLVLEVIAGHDPRDETSVARRFQHAGPGVRTGKLRIAVPKGVSDKEQPAVKENFEASLKALGPVVEITRGVEWPDLPWGPAVGAIVGAEGAAAFLDLIESGGVKELRCPRDRRGGYAGTLIPAVDYLQAMRLRRPMKAAVNKLYERFDAIAAPTRASVAYPTDKNFEDVYPGIDGGPPLIAAGNLCGLPALAVPNGYGENGLPTSLSFMGAAFSESRLLALGMAWQQRSDFHRRRPPAV
jgi:aspartyl-tRNA(Asn)/glutamyl-tRNA(Gln) amidotransferase subunit A